MSEPSKAELLEADPRSFDTERLQFHGLRGDVALHLTRAQLEATLAALPPAPKDKGTVVRLLARGLDSSRELPRSVELSVEGGMPGDRWAQQERYGPEYQLATIYSGYADVVANGQAPELHGDNLFLDLDPSAENLPVGTELAVGAARLVVTPQAHNGCKKWAQRFGLPAMQLNMDKQFRPRRLRGYYLRVLEAGEVAVGDTVSVLSRPG